MAAGEEEHLNERVEEGGVQNKLLGKSVSVRGIL